MRPTSRPSTRTSPGTRRPCIARVACDLFRTRGHAMSCWRRGCWWPTVGRIRRTAMRSPEHGDSRSARGPSGCGRDVQRPRPEDSRDGACTNPDACSGAQPRPPHPRRPPPTIPHQARPPPPLPRGARLESPPGLPRARPPGRAHRPSGEHATRVTPSSIPRTSAPPWRSWRRFPPRCSSPKAARLPSPSPSTGSRPSTAATWAMSSSTSRTR